LKYDEEQSLKSKRIVLSQRKIKKKFNVATLSNRKDWKGWSCHGKHNIFGADISANDG